MGLVLWVDENTFSTVLFEKVFKREGLAFYTLPKANDFAYLVQELAPEVLVLDAKTAINDLDQFKRQYEASSEFSHTPLILLDPLPGLEFLRHKIGEIRRPIDPFTLPDLIKDILTGFKQEI